MDYQKSIQSLLKEAKAGASYKQLGQTVPHFLKNRALSLIYRGICADHCVLRTVILLQCNDVACNLFGSVAG